MHDLRSNDEVLEEYIYTPFWESDETESLLLSKDCILEFPFSPPGMPKSFPREKRAVLIDWLRRTVRSWSREDVVKYPTSDASRYWIESRTKAIVKWGGEIERQFDCTHIELVIIQDGRILTARTWSDPLAYYRGMGVNLPVFHFDGSYSEGEPIPDTPTKFILAGDEEKAIARKSLHDYFLLPDFFDENRDTPAEAHLFDPGFTLKMPFMPVGMKRVFDDQFRTSTTEWVKRTLVDWHQNTDFTRDQFLNPDVVIVESNGSYGKVKWDPSGAVSGYWNDYVIFVSTKNFRITEFREYLDPINKLISAGAQIPVFPFFY